MQINIKLGGGGGGGGTHTPPTPIEFCPQKIPGVKLKKIEDQF